MVFTLTRHRRESEERLEREIAEREKAEAKLRALEASFEQRVAMRTAELARANAELERERDRLRESRDALALAMRGGRMGAWSRDLETNRLWWSRELEEIFGLAPGTFEGSEDGFFAYVHEDDHALLKTAVEEALRDRTDYTVEFRFRHSSGEWRWMEARGRAVYGARGEPLTLYGIGIDTTTRRRSEDELRRENAELTEADRRKDEFLAVLAHELRNPLAPIKNSVTMLKARPMPDEQMAWARDAVERQVDLMARLLDDLLDVSSMAREKLELRKERVELAHVVDTAVARSRPLIDAAGHELTISVPSEPVYVDADSVRLAQVLANLLDNAAKYTERGGHIRLSANVEGRELVISVKDDGIGIAEEHLPRLFDMFAQTTSALHRAQGGLGIGLSLARALVELHGGSVMAYSEGPGRGSEFMVRLPLARTRMLERDAHAPEEPAAPAGRRILVADDNHDAAESLAMMLRMGGNDVRTGRDGVEAVTIAHSYHPQVVLLDIGMPRMNGYDAARRIRSEPWGREMMLIALTGWGQDEDKRRAREAGFDHHLTKPVDADELEKLVASARPVQG
jgi:PAS domain S-box-containing protein